MDRVINIQPVFVDFDIPETGYDSLAVKIFLSILLIITTIVLIIFFWDEILMMFAILLNFSVSLSNEEEEIVKDKKAIIDDLLNTNISCSTINNLTRIQAKGPSDTYFLHNLDDTEMSFINDSECEMLLQDLKSLS